MNIWFSSLSGMDKTESISMRKVLRRMGHRVFFFSVPAVSADPARGSWVEMGFSLETTIEGLADAAGFAPDLLLYVEPGGLIPRGMERAPFPTACILCDTHMSLNVRQQQARFFDHVFLYHRNYLKHFTDHGPEQVHWLPFASDLEVFRPMDVERDLDVAFVGQLMSGSTARLATMKYLASKFRSNDQRYYLQREIPTVYSRAKIVLNMPLKDDLNFRTFEAMSCGAMLLTRRIDNGQEELFREGTHFAAYADDDEMIEKIDYYLAHTDERVAIANAGLAEIRAHHRLEQRLGELLHLVCERPQPVAPVRRITSAQVDREYARLYEHWRAPEAGLRLVREAQLAGRPWLGLVPSAARSVLRMALR